MEIVHKIPRLWVYVSIAFVFSLFTHLFQLNVLPAFITHDEVYYAVEAQTIALSATDIAGTWRPWYFTAASSLYAELPGTVIALGRWLGSNQLMAARISSAVIGAIFPFLLAAIATELLQKQKVFWFVWGVATFNPWVFQFSRMSFDALFSLFFYTLGLLLLLKLKDTYKWAAAIPFFVGFFQYQGLKLILLPILFTTVLFIWDRAHRPTLKTRRTLIFSLLFLVLFSVGLFASFTLRLRYQASSSRVADLIFFKDDLLRSKVNDDRRLSLQSPINMLATNKMTALAQALLSQYVKAFDLGQLFVYGESFRNPFSVWTMGMFYTIDLVFILIGIGWLFSQQKTRALAILLVSWLLIAPLPVAINSIDAWLMFRAAWLIPTLLLLSGIGAFAVWSSPLQILKVGAMSIYAFSILWFGYQYWYRYPLYSTKDKGFSERIMSSYVDRIGIDKQVKILANESWFVSQSYLYYRNLIKKDRLPAIQQAFQQKKFQFENVEIDTRCFDTRNLGPNDVVITEASNTPCENHQPSKEVKQSAIASLMDSGSIYRIYNDQLCTQYNLRGYTQVNQRRLLDIDHLSNEEFCEAYFTYDQ